MSDPLRVRPLFLLSLGVILIVFGAGTGYALLTGRLTSGSRAPAGCLPGEPVEQPAPALRLADLEGTPASLDDLRGRVVLLNLWAAWCPPCRDEMPDLQEFYEAHREAGLVVIGINIGESRATAADFAAAHRLTFPIWLDPEEVSPGSLGAFSLPATFAVDRAGSLRLAWIGPVCREQLEAQAAPLLSETPQPAGSAAARGGSGD